MNAMQSSWWLILAGVATAVLAGFVAMAVATALRRIRYTKAKVAPVRVSFLDRYPAPPISRTDEEKARDATLYELTQKEHTRAKKLQDASIANLAGASVMLCVAFIGAAVSSSVLAHNEWFHLYSSALDVAALLMVPVLFRRYGKAHKEWTQRRSVTEFLRQWALTDSILLAPTDLTKDYSEFASRVSAKLKGNADELMEAVSQLGKARLDQMDQALRGLSVLPVERWCFYLVRRPYRQAHWFATSLKRIDHQHHRRHTMMFVLFLSATLAALIKLGFLFAGVHEEVEAVTHWATLAMLVSIGFAAASTSVLAGQNLRSVKHRYAAQLRAIEAWFATHARAIGLAQQAGPIASADLGSIAAAVVDFERMAIVEHIDWLAVTSEDVMELAPA
jgi:hypothetical protein